MRVAGAAWVGACALALASSGAAALLHFLWSAPLSAAVAQPLPFLVLSLGVIAATALTILRAGTARLCGPGPQSWHDTLASKLECAGRILVGNMQTHGDEKNCCQALHLLQILFDAAAKEAGRGASDAVARCASLGTDMPCSLAEHSACGLATKFEALVLRMATSARIEHHWVSRSVTAVAEALDCVPEATAGRTSLSGQPHAMVAATLNGVQLLVFPIYAAAVAESAWSAAALALVAAAVPAGLGLLLFSFRESDSDERDVQHQSEYLTRRRRLLNLRMTELQSMAVANAPKAPLDVAPNVERKPAMQCVGALPKKGERNQSALNLDLESSKGDKQESSQAANKEVPEDSQGEDLYNEVPPFTMVGVAESKTSRLLSASPRCNPMVVRAIPVRKDVSVQGSLAQVLGEIGMLDPKGAIMSLGSAMQWSPSSDSGTSEDAPTVSTFQILTGATATPLLEPVTPDNAAHQPQNKLLSSPDLTPIGKKRDEDRGAPPGRVRETASVQESLPDVSQNEVSLMSFSLSPGGTAHNTSGILPSPGLILQDEKRHEKNPLVPAFNAAGLHLNPSHTIPNQHGVASDTQHNSALVARVIAQRPQPPPRARAIC
jgi:hypothetical protein